MILGCCSHQLILLSRKEELKIPHCMPELGLAEQPPTLAWCSGWAPHPPYAACLPAVWSSGSCGEPVLLCSPTGHGFESVAEGGYLHPTATFTCRGSQLLLRFEPYLKLKLLLFCLASPPPGWLTATVAHPTFPAGDPFPRPAPILSVVSSAFPLAALGVWGCD